jgi:hypothetical protein
MSRAAVSPAGAFARSLLRKKYMPWSSLARATKDRPRRTAPIAIRFDQFTLARRKALAELRNTGYQTLLKQFLAERL